jgi:glycosyltransferase involved in cell wall biosynthesis
VKKPERAVLVSNVRHVNHQLEALRRLDLAVDFFGLRLFDPAVHETLANNRLTRHLSAVLSQRVGRWPGSVNFHGLGPGSYTPALQARLPLPDNLAFARTHLGLQRLAVSMHPRSLRGARILHFVEGLGGHRLGARVDADTSLVMERRALHPRDMGLSLETYGRFPAGRPSGQSSMLDLLDAEFEAANAVLVYSEEARQSCIKHGVPKEKLWIVPLPFHSDGNDLSPPCAAPDRPTFVFVGKCEAYKGIDIAVQAVSDMPGAHLTVVGWAAPEVQDWLRRQPHVDYLGVQSRRSIREVFTRSTALLSPSKESFGLVILEALHAGLPCMVSDTTGISTALRELAPECVVEGRRPERWTARLHDVAAWDPGKRFDVTGRSQSVLERFTYEESVAAQCRLYRHLLHHRQ